MNNNDNTATKPRVPTKNQKKSGNKGNKYFLSSYYYLQEAHLQLLFFLYSTMGVYSKFDWSCLWWVIEARTEFLTWIDVKLWANWATSGKY